MLRLYCCQSKCTTFHPERAILARLITPCLTSLQCERAACLYTDCTTKRDQDVRTTAEDARAAYQCYLPLPPIWPEGERDRDCFCRLLELPQTEGQQSMGRRLDTQRLTCRWFVNTQVSVWLYDNLEFRLEGKIIVSRLDAPSYRRDHSKKPRIAVKP